MARKKEDRDSGKYKRLATNKSKKSHGGNEDAETLRAQLLPLGLELREVPGDGNCLFRALGDQLDGHMGNHYRHRQDTTNYMLENRDDFQPFVEDDVPFEKHISQLSQLGTYAGNDAIVAFARLHQVAVVIHQPNTPLWQIKGWETEAAPTKKGKGGKAQPNKLGRQLHIAYHGGDHYDSVRKLGDTSHIPANILIDIENSSSDSTSYESHPYVQDDQDYAPPFDVQQDIDSVTDLERQAMERSGCQDLPTVRQLLYNNCGNLDAAVEDLMALTVDQQEMHPAPRRTTHLSRKQLEKIKKQERKRASEARRKVQASSSSPALPDETIVIGKVQCLNI